MFFFFFNDTATTEIYTLSLHDALPISAAGARAVADVGGARCGVPRVGRRARALAAEGARRLRGGGDRLRGGRGGEVRALPRSGRAARDGDRAGLRGGDARVRASTRRAPACDARGR